MTEWLIRTFVKNPEETYRMEVRSSYCMLSGMVGILCNLILAAVKLTTGLLSGSAAILSDAVNNLTDCVSCVLSLIGNRIAVRPADSEHPFGHGRMEYLVSFAVTALIFTAGFELFLRSVEKILHPTALTFSPVMGLVLVCTIGVKYWMGCFNRTLGERLDHSGMKATAQDSVNDAVATAMTLGSTILSVFFPNMPFDGIMGALVSLYIIRGGFELCREVLGKILGDEPDTGLKEDIREIIQAQPGILGVHDIIIHDYGAGNRIGSAHAELPASLSLQEAHRIVDECETAVENKLHVKLTIHADPAETDDATEQARRRTENLLAEISPGITVHDFHLLEEDGRTVYRFDAAIPFEADQSGEEIRALLEEKLAAAGNPVRCIITFDRGYFSERSG